MKSVNLKSFIYGVGVGSFINLVKFVVDQGYYLMGSIDDLASQKGHWIYGDGYQ